MVRRSPVFAAPAERLGSCARGAFLALVVSGGATLPSCGSPEAPTPPAPPSLEGLAPIDDVGDFYALAPVPEAPTGSPLTLRTRRRDGASVRVRGSVRFVQRVTGSAPPEGAKPSWSLDGTFDGHASLRAAADDGWRAAFSGTLAATVVRPPSPAHADETPISLVFDVGSGGALAPRSVVFEAPADRKDALDLLRQSLVRPAPLVDREIRVGDVFSPAEAAETEDLQRALWFLFRGDTTATDGDGAPAAAPVEGLVAVEARESYRGEDVLVIRTAVRQAYRRRTRAGVEVSLRARVEARRRVATSDALVRTTEVRVRREYRFRAEDFDYRVDVLERLEATVEREE